MNNPPAFPAMHFDLADNEHGMTLRDYFAAKAMQVLMAETDGINDDKPGAPSWQSDTVAELAYEQADAMLVARKPE
jgi:hypothetical protein